MITALPAGILAKQKSKDRDTEMEKALEDYLVEKGCMVTIPLQRPITFEKSDLSVILTRHLSGKIGQSFQSCYPVQVREGVKRMEFPRPAAVLRQTGNCESDSEDDLEDSEDVNSATYLSAQ